MDRAECYQILGLECGASTAEVKTAYRDLAKVWHPDRFGSEPRLQGRASEMMKNVNLAYDALQSNIFRSTKRTAPPPSPPHRASTAAKSQQTEPQQAAWTPKPCPRYIGFWRGLAVLVEAVFVSGWVVRRSRNH